MKSFLLFLPALLFCLNAAAQGEVVYENSQNYLARFNGVDNEAGDQVQFTDENRLINYFAFEYFGGFQTGGDAKARVRFYLNDGPVSGSSLAEPGTLLYDSGSFSIIPGSQTVEISDLAVFVRGDILTWTVQFEGLATNETAGALFYDSPHIGRSDNFLWERDNGQWQAVASPGVTNNLAAKFTAVPEFRIRSIEQEDGTTSITASATAGKFYSLEFKSAVTNTTWEAVNLPPTPAMSNPVSLTHTSTNKLLVFRVAERDMLITRTETGVNVVSFATPGKRYALEASADRNAWSRLQTATATGSTVVFDAITKPGDEFFRVVEI